MNVFSCSVFIETVRLSFLHSPSSFHRFIMFAPNSYNAQVVPAPSGPTSPRGDTFQLQLQQQYEQRVSHMATVSAQRVAVQEHNHRLERKVGSLTIHRFVLTAFFLIQTLSRTLTQLQLDGSVTALARDPSSISFIRTRLDELLTSALRDEREQLMQAQMKQIAEQSARLQQLESSAAAAAQAKSAAWESAQRSSLTLSHSTSHIARLEAELKDATREAQVAKASEQVYKGELAKLQAHADSQQKRIEQMQRDNADLAMSVQNALEQNALQAEHAKEQALVAELTDRKWRAKHQKLQDQLAELQAQRQREQDALQAGAAETLRSELSTLKTQSSHDALIALHEQKQSFERKLAEQESSWQKRWMRWRKSCALSSALVWMISSTLKIQPNVSANLSSTLNESTLSSLSGSRMNKSPLCSGRI
jgi:chromosome segregation ATPase